jgi:hypothetical protein
MVAPTGKASVGEMQEDEGILLVRCLVRCESQAAMLWELGSKA